nr:YqgQ family protein [Bacillus subtilis]
MNTFYDVQQLLKTFYHIVYFGDRELEIEFMLDELKELYMNHMIEKEQWFRAAAVLRKELEQTKNGRDFYKG